MPTNRAREKKNGGDLRNPSVIPPPPGPDASCEEIDAYFSKYSWEQLEKAGHIRTLTAEENRWIDDLAASMSDSCESQKGWSRFSVMLPSEKMSVLIKLAKSRNISPSTLASAWISELLEQQEQKAKGS